MKRVYRTDSLIIVAHLKNILVHEGIPCIIKNDRLLGALGEIPFLECWPEVWVVNDEDAEGAERVIHQALRGESDTGAPWICPGCGEQVEGQFAVCWQCGASCPSDLE